MGSILRAIDSLFGTILAAAAGLAASQLNAFIHQYLQRLGGHLDEAGLAHRRILEGVSGQPVEPDTQARLAEAALARVEELASAMNAIAGAHAAVRPFVFAARLEPTIASATFHGFQPAVPLDAVSLAYGAAGMVLAWLLHGLLKRLVRAPFRASARPR